MSKVGNILKITSHIIPDTVKNATLNPAIKILDKASSFLADTINNHTEKELAKTLSKHPTNTHLFIKPKPTPCAVDYDILDENEQIKYIVKDDFVTLKHHLHIYDPLQTEVASISEKLFTFHPTLLSKFKPIDFSLEIEGNKLGILKSSFSNDNPKFKLDSKEWLFIGDIPYWKYTIRDTKNEIAYISHHTFGSGNIYLLDFPNKKDELLVLSLVLAVSIVNSRQTSKT